MKNYLIVGASSGIGLATAELLAKTDANLYTLSRSMSDQLSALNTTHTAYDVTTDDVQKISDFLPSELNGMVYCPGSINLKPFNRLSEDDFINDYKVNVLGAVKIIQSILPQLQAGKPSSIVLFSTVASKVGMNFHASISAAKSAVEGLARSLAAEFARDFIRVNVIAPSVTDTPLANNLLNSDKKIEAAQQRHPLKKIGTPQDLAHSVNYLLGDQSSWITGQTIHVDGGLSSLKVL